MGLLLWMEEEIMRCKENVIKKRKKRASLLRFFLFFTSRKMFDKKFRCHNFFSQIPSVHLYGQRDFSRDELILLLAYNLPFEQPLRWRPLPTYFSESMLDYAHT